MLYNIIKQLHILNKIKTHFHLATTKIIRSKVFIKLRIAKPHRAQM